MTTAPARTRNRRTSPIEFEKHAAERRQWPSGHNMTKAENDLLEREARALIRRRRKIYPSEGAEILGINESRFKRLIAWKNRPETKPAKVKGTGPEAKRDEFEDSYSTTLTHGHNYEPAAKYESSVWGSGDQSADAQQAALDRGESPPVEKQNSTKAGVRRAAAQKRADEQLVKNHLEGVEAYIEQLSYEEAAEREDAPRLAREAKADEENAAELVRKKLTASQWRRKYAHLVASQERSARETDCPIDGEPWIRSRAPSVMGRMLNRSKDAK